MTRAHDIEEVTAANLAFYQAFERLDLEAMEEVWSHGEEVRCVHPGWPPLEGWPEVRESWQSIFANTETIRFMLSDVQVLSGGEMAWVFLVEHIDSDAGEGMASAQVAATNLYERQGGRWRLVLHHASATPTVTSKVQTDPTQLN